MTIFFTPDTIWIALKKLIFLQMCEKQNVIETLLWRQVINYQFIEFIKVMSSLNHVCMRELIFFFVNKKFNKFIREKKNVIGLKLLYSQRQPSTKNILKATFKQNLAANLRYCRLVFQSKVT